MQWNAEKNAGFSETQPWLPVSPSYTTHNVAAELQDPSSILQTYRQILALRHKNAALLDGEYFALNVKDPNVLSYLRRYKDQAVLVVLNMSGQTQERQLRPNSTGVCSEVSTHSAEYLGNEIA